MAILLHSPFHPIVISCEMLRLGEFQRILLLTTIKRGNRGERDNDDNVIAILFVVQITKVLDYRGHHGDSSKFCCKTALRNIL